MDKIIKTSQKLKLLFLAVFLVCFNFSGSGSGAQAASDVSDIQDDMENVQDKIEDVQNQLQQSQTQYNQNQYQINTTAGLIQKTETEIERKERELDNLDKRIKLNKEILSTYIQEMYYSDQAAASALVLEKKDFSDYLGNFDQILNAKEKVLGLISEIEEDQEKLTGVKKELAEKKEDHEKLLAIKQAEQAEVAADIQDAKTTLSQLSDKLDKLRSRYSEILGKSVSTKDIVEAAKFAAKVTGMNKSFLLGVLVQESNKGQSTGSCDYKESRMTSTQLTAFKNICDELDYNYKKQKVSCPPKSYKGTGGAMGVPQFMPTTWQGWKSKIASATGHKTPDPWNLVDGVTAMALKLSADGADSKKRDDEARSYCVYLAGGYWKSYCPNIGKYKSDYEDYNCWSTDFLCDKNGKNCDYGKKVLCLKDNYEKYY